MVFITVFGFSKDIVYGNISPDNDAKNPVKNSRTKIQDAHPVGDKELNLQNKNHQRLSSGNNHHSKYKKAKRHFHARLHFMHIDR